MLGFAADGDVLVTQIAQPAFDVVEVRRHCHAARLGAGESDSGGFTAPKPNPIRPFTASVTPPGNRIFTTP